MRDLRICEIEQARVEHLLLHLNFEFRGSFPIATANREVDCDFNSAISSFVFVSRIAFNLIEYLNQAASLKLGFKPIIHLTIEHAATHCLRHGPGLAGACARRMGSTVHVELEICDSREPI